MLLSAHRMENYSFASDGLMQNVTMKFTWILVFFSPKHYIFMSLSLRILWFAIDIDKKKIVNQQWNGTIFSFCYFHSWIIHIYGEYHFFHRRSQHDKLFLFNNFYSFSFFFGFVWCWKACEQAIDMAKQPQFCNKIISTRVQCSVHKCK